MSFLTLLFLTFLFLLVGGLVYLLIDLLQRERQLRCEQRAAQDAYHNRTRTLFEHRRRQHPPDLPKGDAP